MDESHNAQCMESLGTSVDAYPFLRKGSLAPHQRRSWALVLSVILLTIAGVLAWFFIAFVTYLLKVSHWQTHNILVLLIFFFCMSVPAFFLFKISTFLCQIIKNQQMIQTIEGQVQLTGIVDYDSGHTTVLVGGASCQLPQKAAEQLNPLKIYRFFIMPLVWTSLVLGVEEVCQNHPTKTETESALSKKV